MSKVGGRGEKDGKQNEQKKKKWRGVTMSKHNKRYKNKKQHKKREKKNSV